MTDYRFPKDFIWGVAASAPQIEGAFDLDGKGLSIWDTYCRKPGTVAGGDTLDTSIDHYHRYADDFRLMREFGVRNYRLSISWPRILPLGEGAVNQKGIDFYRRLLETLRAEGIRPWVNFFHSDMPQALEEKYNGWISRRVPELFGEYCEIVVRQYRDLVDQWITLNEPQMLTGNYGCGLGAPGRHEDARTVNQVMHHALLAHGLAVSAVRKWGRPGSQVGVVHNPTFCIPAVETDANIEAARILSYRDVSPFMDPLFKREYPAWWREEQGDNYPKYIGEDLRLIGQPCDWFGLNVYSGIYARWGEGGKPEKVCMPPGYPRSDVGWQAIVPDAVYWATRFTHELYEPRQIHIAENGLACKQQHDAHEQVQDLDRIAFLRENLRMLHRAVGDGLPVHAYFHWTMFDNYEWMDGYSKKFGLVAVHDGSLERVPKFSAHWYREVMKTNRVV